MKTQKHNQGELAELKLMIEKQLVEDIALMAENSSYTQEEIVAIALKRFRTHHADYMHVVPKLEVE